MPKPKKKLSSPPASTLLSRDQLMKSKLAKVNGCDTVFVVPPFIAENKEACRHLTFINKMGNEIIYSDRCLRAKFWNLNIFDASDWHTRFKKMDKIVAQMRAQRHLTLCH